MARRGGGDKGADKDAFSVCSWSHGAGPCLNNSSPCRFRCRNVCQRLLPCLCGHRVRSSRWTVFVVLVTLGLDLPLPHLGDGQHGHATGSRSSSLLSLVVRANLRLPRAFCPLSPGRPRPGLFHLNDYQDACTISVLKAIVVSTWGRPNGPFLALRRSP